MRIINEPTAAAIAYGLDKKNTTTGDHKIPHDQHLYDTLRVLLHCTAACMKLPPEVQSPHAAGW